MAKNGYSLPIMEKNHGWSWDTKNGIPFMNGPMNQAPRWLPGNPQTIPGQFCKWDLSNSTKNGGLSSHQWP
jgi:hypothetical protein